MEDKETLTAEESQYFDSRGGEIELNGDNPLPTDATAAPDAGGQIDDTINGEQPPQENQESPAKVKTVPHAALHAEREEHRKTKAAHQQAQDELRRLQAWVEQASLQPQQQQQEAPPPNPEDDIIGAIQYYAQQQQAIKDTLAQQQAQQQEASYKQQQEQQRQEEYTRFLTAAEVSLNEYKAECPDVSDAMQFLAEKIDDEYKSYASINPQYEDANFRAQLANDEAERIMRDALSRGLNPFDYLYKIARAKGYKGAQNTAQQNLIQNVSNAQHAGRTLASSHGSPVAGKLTLEDISNLPEEEFSAWADKNPAAFRAIMGG